MIVIYIVFFCENKLYMIIYKGGSSMGGNE